MRSLPIKKARVVNTINASAYIADVTYVGRDNPVRVIVSDVDGTPTNLETIITHRLRPRRSARADVCAALALLRS